MRRDLKEKHKMGEMCEGNLERAMEISVRASARNVRVPACVVVHIFMFEGAICEILLSYST